MTAAEQARPPESGKVVVVPWTRNERAATAGLKTTSYADNVVALAYAKARGASEAIFGNTRGELCEGTGSNVFVVIDGVIVTPPGRLGRAGGHHPRPGPRVVPGGRAGRDERALPLDVLETAEEVFITSSTRDVLAVHAVDDRELAPGPVTSRAAKVFAARASEDLDP